APARRAPLRRRRVWHERSRHPRTFRRIRRAVRLDRSAPMKAAIYPGAGKAMVIEDVPDPTPGPDDVIIKVHRCGICGTDLHMTEGHQWQFSANTIPGHEYAGEIVEVGANVAGLRKGDLITALPSTGCGACEACRQGNFPLCHSAPGVMGGYAEYNR